MKKVINESFKDLCKVYRVEEVSSFSDESEVTVIYEGWCDAQIPMTIRTFRSGGVLKTDRAVYIRGLIKGIKSGDLIDIEFQDGNVMNELPISAVYARTMGTMLILNEAEN